MAKLTLLDMVQNILSAMDSDHVNSIGDTVESDQVATIIKETYFDLISNVIDVPEHEEIVNLTALADTNHPTWFQFPANVKRITLFKYNNATVADTDLRYVEVKHKTPVDFEKYVNARTESDTNVVAYTDFNAGKLLIINDKHPQYWTTFDDKYLICDSFLNTVDSTLQSSKTFCLCLTEPTWTHSDTFTPDLDAEFFPLFLAEAKSTCFVNLKQVANAKEEKKARRQLTHIHNKAHKKAVDRHAAQPDYGR